MAAGHHRNSDKSDADLIYFYLLPPCLTADSSHHIFFSVSNRHLDLSFRRLTRLKVSFLGNERAAIERLFWTPRRACIGGGVVYCQRDAGKHRPRWLSGCQGGKVRWREANKSTRAVDIGGKSWTFRTGFDPASQSIMPVKNLAQACRIGLDFFEFLKESDRTSITDRLELREIYNTEFRSR